MNMKLYFSDFDEGTAHTKDWLLERMKEEDLTYLEVREAKRMLGTSFFFCKAIGFVGERGDGFNDCGKTCKDYKPRNGKSGCCTHRGFCYEPGTELILKSNGKLKKLPF